jgi:hypothetical protein
MRYYFTMQVMCLGSLDAAHRKLIIYEIYLHCS